MIPKDVVAKARKASLVKYFEKQGYVMKPVPSRRGIQYKIDDFGGLFVRDHMFYQFSTTRSGNAIECLTDVLGYKFQTAVLELAKPDYETSHVPYVAPERASLKMPPRANSVSRIYSYLINTRRLDPSIVSLMIQHKLLYQDTKGNAVFVHMDENKNPIGGEIQGTLSNVRFKGIVEGTQSSAFEIQKGKPDKVFLFESAIDLLSYIQLHRYNVNENDVLYASMGGLKKEIVLKYIDRGFTIISKVDNDAAGHRFNKMLWLEIELPDVTVHQDPQHEFVYGILPDGQYVFPTAEDYNYFKNELKPVNFQLLQPSSVFHIDDGLSKKGKKDWNELL